MILISQPHLPRPSSCLIAAAVYIRPDSGLIAAAIYLRQQRQFYQARTMRKFLCITCMQPISHICVRQRTHTTMTLMRIPLAADQARSCCCSPRPRTACRHTGSSFCRWLLSVLQLTHRLGETLI